MALPDEEESVMRKLPAGRKQPFWPFMRITGKKPFLPFALVTFLMVGIMSATNVVSKYALKAYTEDQIQRIKWDAIAYQLSDVTEVKKIAKRLSEMDGITSVRNTGSVKLSLGTFMHLKIAGGDTNIPWFMLVAADDPNLLPPELRPRTAEAVTALVGSQAMISPYRDKIALGDLLSVYHNDPDRPGPPTELFAGKISRLSTPERLEIVKFFLDEFGSASFIPDGSLIQAIPKSAFDAELPRLARQVHELSKPQPLVGGGEEGEGQTEPEEENMGASLLPEIMHLISFDRRKVVNGWDLHASAQSVSELVAGVKSTTTGISFESFVNSELQETLQKMAQVSRLIGLLTILISFPILWLVWLFAGGLANLIILNQRRLVGLLRLRGASYRPIRQSLLLSIGLAGIFGGAGGALAGTLIPYLLYRLSGVEIPLSLLFTTIQEPHVLAVFIALGTGFGLLAGSRVTSYMARITPLDASRRVLSSEEKEFRYEFTRLQLLCLLLGGSKIAAWIIGLTPKMEFLKAVDSVLNFVGAAFFLYGFAALLVSQREQLERVLIVLTRPLAGELGWFSVRNMLVRPHRVRTVILVAALTFGVVVYPPITSGSFYEKTVRALRLNLGADVAVRFDATELTRGEVKLLPIKQHIQNVASRIASVQEQIGKLDGVRKVGALYEFSVPGNFFIAGQNYLQLFLIERPDQFLDKVYFENKLGVEKPFRALLQEMGKDDVLLSKGFLASFDPGTSRSLGLGRDKDGEIEARVAGTLHMLPGLSQFMINDRESFSSASVEFINAVSRSRPYVIGRLDAGNLQRLEAVLANVVVHVDGNGEGGRVAEELLKLREQGGIPPFTNVYTEEKERDKLRSDMFVFLVLQNIKVFMVGGILAALAGLIATAIVNFTEGKRIFALLRLRGASPRQLRRVLLADLVAPLAVGACIGVPVGLITGYGLTNAIFALPRAASILEIIPVHLTLSWAVGGIVAGVLAFFFLSAFLLSSWVFRKTAREALVN